MVSQGGADGRVTVQVDIGLLVAGHLRARGRRLAPFLGGFGFGGGGLGAAGLLGG